MADSAPPPPQPPGGPAALAKQLSHRPSTLAALARHASGVPSTSSLHRHMSVLSEQVQGLIAEAASPPEPPSLLSLAEAVCLLAVGALLALYAPTSLVWRVAAAWLLVECAAYVAFESR